MKKTLTILLALLLIFSLAACGGGGGSKGDTIDSIAKTYNLDLTSEEQQPMSTESPSSETLSTVVHDFLKDNTFFFETDMENTTYADIKAQIGVDASYYYFEDALVQKQNFLWVAEDDETVKLLISFSASDGKLYAAGSTNIK